MNERRKEGREEGREHFYAIEEGSVSASSLCTPLVLDLSGPPSAAAYSDVTWRQPSDLVGTAVCKLVGTSVCKLVGTSVCKLVGTAVYKLVGTSVFKLVGTAVCKPLTPSNWWILVSCSFLLPFRRFPRDFSLQG
jgi:hypothetical protein